MRAELTRVRELTEPLADLNTTLERINQNLGRGSTACLTWPSRRRANGPISIARRSTRGRRCALHDALAPVDERVATIEGFAGELGCEVGAICRPAIQPWFVHRS